MLINSEETMITEVQTQTVTPHPQNKTIYGHEDISDLAA